MSSIPALSHLNTLFPASMRRPQRVLEMFEPNRGETGLGRCSQSRGARVKPLEPGKGREGNRLEAPRNRGAPPLLTLLPPLCLPPLGVRSPQNALPAAEKRPGKEERGGELRRGAFPCAVKWPEAKE